MASAIMLTTTTLMSRTKKAPTALTPPDHTRGEERSVLESRKNQHTGTASNIAMLLPEYKLYVRSNTIYKGLAKERLMFHN